jgi:hypothetical protein
MIDIIQFVPLFIFMSVFLAIFLYRKINLFQSLNIEQVLVVLEPTDVYSMKEFLISSVGKKRVVLRAKRDISISSSLQHEWSVFNSGGELIPTTPFPFFFNQVTTFEIGCVYVLQGSFDVKTPGLYRFQLHSHAKLRDSDLIFIVDAGKT